MKTGALSVTDGTPSRDLVDLATLKAELGVTGSSLNTKLERLIGAFGAAVTNYLDREPWHQGYEEKGPSQGGLFLRLSAWPVDRIVSIVDSDGDTIAAADYEISGHRRDRAYREDGWILPDISLNQHNDRKIDYTASYYAGWLMPGQVLQWKASKVKAVGDWVKASDAGVRLRFEATVAGTTGGTEPTWPTTAGDTVADNTVTWTAREAEELPKDVEQIGLIQVIDWFRGGMAMPVGIVERRTGDVTTRYDPAASQVGFLLLPAAKAVLRHYR